MAGPSFDADMPKTVFQCSWMHQTVPRKHLASEINVSVCADVESTEPTQPICSP